MKKIILLALLTLAVANGYSQEQGKFRVGLDLGYAPSDSYGGAMFSLEPKYNIKDNMNLGLRIGVAFVIRDGTSSSGGSSLNGSFVGTYDYYFHKSGSSFAPYLGAGVGYYSLIEPYVTSSNTAFNPSFSGKMGALIRGGFERAGFRMGLEYNLLPDFDIENTNGDKVGTLKNSYLGIHIGFFVGGGKWRK